MRPLIALKKAHSKSFDFENKDFYRLPKLMAFVDDELRPPALAVPERQHQVRALDDRDVPFERSAPPVFFILG